jgi:segregation and condensation protein B
MEPKATMDIKEAESKIEAILFTMGEAVEAERIAVALEQDVDTIRKILRGMIIDFRESNRGVQIIELNDSFQMCTKPDMYEYVIRVAHAPKKHVLTDALLETLSIIAYKQPITRSEISAIRGVDSDKAVSKLVEYNLAAELGRLEKPGRPLAFGTTEEFLRYFGLSSLSDLPIVNPEKLEDFKLEVQEELQLTLDL